MGALNALKTIPKSKLLALTQTF